MAVSYTHLAAAMKKAVTKCKVITVNALTPESGEKALEDGDADLVAFGRSLIADPYMPQKVKEGRLEDIRPCMRAVSYTHLWGSNNNSVNQVVFSPDNVTVGTAKKLQSARIYKDVTISIGASEALKSIIVQHGLNTTTPIVMLSGNIGNINLT